MDKITSLSFFVKFDNVDERDIYVKLDLLIQFMLKNNLNCSITIHRCDKDIDDFVEEDD